MFQVEIGEKGLNNTWQEPFPKTTECCRCGGEARIGFVASEKYTGNNEEFVAHLHVNNRDGSGFWLHDCCAVAVYFCRQCLEPTVIYNQA